MSNVDNNSNCSTPNTCFNWMCVVERWRWNTTSACATIASRSVTCHGSVRRARWVMKDNTRISSVIRRVNTAAPLVAAGTIEMLIATSVLGVEALATWNAIVLIPSSSSRRWSLVGRLRWFVGLCGDLQLFFCPFAFSLVAVNTSFSWHVSNYRLSLRNRWFSFCVELVMPWILSRVYNLVCRLAYC